MTDEMASAVLSNATTQPTLPQFNSTQFSPEAEATTLAEVMNSTTEETVFTKVVEPIFRGNIWEEEGVTLAIRNSLYTLAGWELALALITIMFAGVIALYGPYVFGSQALVNGMQVMMEFWEFFLPVKYNGRTAEEKMASYSQDEYVRKIRRFSGFIGVAMTGFALFEMITGAVGRAALKDHALGEGSIMGYSAFVTLSVLCGITSFILLFASAQLFRQRFLPEMMLVYSIRNLTMLILFTATWMRALGVDEKLENSASGALKRFESLHNATSAKLNLH